MTERRSKARKAQPDWQHGYRLADDPDFDSERRERQLELFEQVKAGTIPGVVVASDMDGTPPLAGPSLRS